MAPPAVGFRSTYWLEQICAESDLASQMGKQVTDVTT
jgi:hypothetical protein